MNQELDNTGTVVDPAWIFTNVPKPPSQVLESPQLVGSVRTLNLQGSAGRYGATPGGVRSVVMGSDEALVAEMGASPAIGGTINLKGSAVPTKYIEGSVG